MKTKDICLIGVLAALLCIGAPFTVPIGPIPISLASFVVYLAGALLGWKRGTLAVVVYLLLGAVGLPVFSGFQGGLQKLAGVTGGFLIGYIPCALITGAFADHAKDKKWMVPVGMVLGTAALYALGTIWFMVQTHNPLGAALGACVIPFLPGDAIKIAAATVLTLALRKRLEGLIG